MNPSDSMLSQQDSVETEERALEPEAVVQAARAKLERWERLEELRERHGVPSSGPSDEPISEEAGRIVLKALGDVYSQAAAAMARRNGHLMGGYQITDEPGAGYWLYESE
jgi:hypothetical protein